MTPLSGYLERTLTMALGIIEIVEEDCGTDKCIDVIVFSEKHAKSLVGKYYKDPNKTMDWEILDLEIAKQFINRKIFIRSPMTCQTENFKICRKCFGSREFPTNCVGVCSGQIVSERLTQLIMRSFHTSGSSNLTINKDTKQFIQEHITNIFHDEENKQYIIEFNTSELPEHLNSIIGFNYIDDNKLYVNYFTEDVYNIDAIEVMNNIKQILKVDNKVKQHPVTYYENIMKHILSVGTPYSSFIEILLCNMFITSIDDDDHKEFWRYNTGQLAIKKYGDKTLAKNLSKLLGCLFTPNKRTLPNLDGFSDIDLNKLSIHERIWLGNWS